MKFGRVSATTLAVLAVVLFAFWCDTGAGLREVARTWNTPTVPSWVGALPGNAKSDERVADIDTVLIHQGFEKAPTWASTLPWWTGQCVQNVPFYRPLSSYVLWSQWRVFGLSEQRYAVISYTLLLLATLSYALLIRDFWRFFRLPYPALAIILSGLSFVGGIGFFTDQRVICHLVGHLWKNEPDSLTLIFFSVALRAYLSRKQWRALFFYLLVCLTKEAGIFLPFLCAIIELPELWQNGAARRAALRRLLPLFVFLPLFLGLRTLFLHDLYGFRYGSNNAWGFRLFLYASGPLSELVVQKAWISLAWAAALTLAVVVQCRTGRWRVALIIGLAALGVLGTIAAGLESDSSDPIGALFLFLSGRGLWVGVFSACFGGVVWLAFRRAPHASFLALVWAWLALALTLFSPSVMHRYYLMNAGFTLLATIGCVQVVAVFHSKITKEKK